MRWFVVIGCFGCLMGAQAASAQYPYPYGYGYGYQPGAATVGESYARGMADVVRSAGYANLQNSEAAKNYEAARSANLDNRKKATETYFDLKRMNREYRAAANPRPSSDELFRASQEALPSRLSPGELDPLTGEINWPLMLTTDVFKPQRESLEHMFATRAAGVTDFNLYRDMLATTDSMIETLVGLVREVPPQDYAEARSFLKSLRYDVLKPSQ
ncbi:MAG: hypothetical protein KDA62_12675 [Planctomycetales bacterium]|nr:hypothetical protein [Planctomycetales bacterium]MCA9163834.1 hypothetical protein [Planctomycetales bacterium]